MSEARATCEEKNRPLHGEACVKPAITERKIIEKRRIGVFSLIRTKSERYVVVQVSGKIVLYILCWIYQYLFGVAAHLSSNPAG